MPWLVRLTAVFSLMHGLYWFLVALAVAFGASSQATSLLPPTEPVVLAVALAVGTFPLSGLLLLCGWRPARWLLLFWAAFGLLGGVTLGWFFLRVPAQEYHSPKIPVLLVLLLVLLAGWSLFSVWALFYSAPGRAYFRPVTQPPAET